MPAPALTATALRRRVARTPSDARAFRVADDLASLVLPLPYAQIRSVNAYVLIGSTGLTLVDCGSSLDPGWKAIEAALGQVGLVADDIRLLVCTHLHQDHAGLAAVVARRTGCALARGTGSDHGHDAFRDRLIPLSERRRHAMAQGVPESELSRLVGPIIADDGRHERARFDRLLEPGSILPDGASAWEVVPIPGHSAAQIALWQPERRWLISADLVSAQPMLEFRGHGDPVSDHIASLTRAAALGAEMLLPGHGRPVGPARAVDGALANARDAVAEHIALARAAVRSGPVSGYELSLRVNAANLDLEYRQSALSTALCLLEHLAARGEAQLMFGEDGVRRFVSPASGSSR